MITLEICHGWPLNQSQTHLSQSYPAVPLTREIYAIWILFRELFSSSAFLFAFCEYTKEMGKLGCSGK